MFWYETMESAEARRTRELADFDRQIAKKRGDIIGGFETSIRVIDDEIALIDAQLGRIDTYIAQFDGVINRINTEYSGFKTEAERATFLDGLRGSVTTSEREAAVLRRDLKNYKSNDNEAEFYKAESLKFKARIQAITDPETGQANILIQSLRDSIGRGKQRERELGTPAEGSPEAAELQFLRLKIGAAEQRLATAEASLSTIRTYEQNIDSFVEQIQNGGIPNEQIRFLFDTADDFMEDIESELRSILNAVTNGKREIAVGLKEAPDSDQSLVDNLNDRLLAAQINLNYVTAEMNALTNMQALSIKLTEEQKQRLRQLQALANALATRIASMEALSNTLTNKQSLTTKERQDIKYELDQEMPVDEKQQINFYLEMLSYNQGMIANFMGYLARDGTREKPLNLDFLRSNKKDSGFYITQDEFQERFLAEYLLFEHGFIDSKTDEDTKNKMRDCLLNGNGCDAYKAGSGASPDELTIPRLREIWNNKPDKSDKEYKAKLDIYNDFVGKYEFATSFFGGFVFDGVAKGKQMPIGFAGEFYGQDKNIADRLNLVTTEKGVKGRLTWVHTWVNSALQTLNAFTHYAFFSVFAYQIATVALPGFVAAVLNAGIFGIAGAAAVMGIIVLLYMNWDTITDRQFMDTVGILHLIYLVDKLMLGPIQALLVAIVKLVVNIFGAAIAGVLYLITSTLLKKSEEEDEKVVDPGTKQEARDFVDNHKWERWYWLLNSNSIEGGANINLDDPENAQIRAQYEGNINEWSTLFMGLKESDFPNKQLWAKISAAQRAPNLDPNWFQNFDGDEIRAILDVLFPGGPSAGGAFTVDQVQEALEISSDEVNSTMKNIVGNIMKKNMPLVGEGVSIETFKILVVNDVRNLCFQVIGFLLSCSMIQADNKDLKELKGFSVIREYKL